MKVILQALVFSLSVFLVLWMYWIRTITYSISYLELLQSNLPDFTTKEINKVAQHYRYLKLFWMYYWSNIAVHCEGNMATLNIPDSLAKHTSKISTFEIVGETIDEVLTEFSERFPQLCVWRRSCVEQEFTVYLDGIDYRRLRLQELSPVSNRSVLTLAAKEHNENRLPADNQQS